MYYKNKMYSLQKGFMSIDEAKSWLLQHNMNPDVFMMFSVNNEIYIVTMETLAIQIVITKELCYYRNHWFQDTFDFSEIEKYIKKMQEPESPRISRMWDNQYYEIINEIYNVELVYKGDKIRTSYLIYNSIILIACLLNNTINDEKYNDTPIW